MTDTNVRNQAKRVLAQEAGYTCAADIKKARTIEGEIAVASKASVLLYNFQDKKRTGKVKFIFVLMGIRIKTVEKADYLKSLGELAGEEDTEPVNSLFDGEGFDDEMLVLNHFTDSQMNYMLAYLRKEKLQIPLKAVLTPTNRSWNSLELYAEIKKEHEQMTGR